MDEFTSFAVDSLTGLIAEAYRPADLAAAIRVATDAGAAKQTLHWGRKYL